MKQKRVHVAKVSFHGNPNIGMYGFCTGKYVLLGPEVPAHLHELYEEVFHAKVKVLTIAGTSFLGVFLAGNSNCMLVPSVIQDAELAKIKALNINYQIIETKYSCLGNNILVNDAGALVSPEYSNADLEKIGAALQVPCMKGKLVEVNTVGSVAVMNNKGGLVHYEAKQDEIAFLKKHFKISIDHGSVNLGNPFVKSGILLSDQGFLIGDLSGGPEIVHADRTFGFTEN